MSDDFVLRAVLGVKDDASGPAARIGNYFVNLKDKIKATEGGLASFNKHMDTLKSGMKFLAAGTAAGLLTKSFISADIEASKLASNIRSLGVTKDEVEGITTKVKELAGEMGTSQEVYLTGIYDLKSAVSTLDPKQLVDISKALDLTAKATKGDFAGLSDLFGTTYAQFKDMYKNLSDTQFAGLFGNTITLVSNLYKTDGAKMQQAMQSLGSTAAVMNISLEEQSVILGKLQNTDLAGVAGTSYRSFLSHVSEGMKELGLSATDAQGKLKSMPELLETISQKFGSTIEPDELAKLTKAFNEEGARMVSALMPKYKSLREEIQQVKSANADGNWNAMKEAAAINMDNLATGLDRTGAGWKALQSTIAKGFNEGPLKVITNGVADIFSGLTKILNEHSYVRQFVATVIFGGTAFLLLAGGVKVATATLGLYTLLSKAAGTNTLGFWDSIKNIIPSIWTAVTATWAWTVALLANPITWIVIGVAALLTGIVLLVKNWDSVKAAAASAWNSIKNSWGKAPGWFKGIVAIILLPFWPFIQLGKLIANNWGEIKIFFTGLFDTIASVFTKIWEVVSGVLDKMWEKIQAVWEPLKSGLEKVGNFFFGGIEKQAEKSGKGMMTAYAKGIKAMMDAPIKALTSVHKEIQANSNQSDAKKGPLSNTSKWGRSFVSTWAGGVDREARSNDVVKRFVNLQSKQINDKSPVIQKLSEGKKTEAKNLFGNLNLSVDGNEMTVDKLAGMLAQVIFQELNKVTAV